MLFARTFDILAFQWFEGLPEGSIITFQDLQIAFKSQFQTEMTRVMARTLLEELQKPNVLVKEYLGRWPAMALQCHEMKPRTKYDICVQNMVARSRKQLSKRKEAMIVTSPMLERKRRAQGSYRTSKWILAKESKEQPYNAPTPPHMILSALDHFTLTALKRVMPIQDGSDHMNTSFWTSDSIVRLCTRPPTVGHLKG